MQTSLFQLLALFIAFFLGLVHVSMVFGMDLVSHLLVNIAQIVLSPFVTLFKLVINTGIKIYNSSMELLGWIFSMRNILSLLDRSLFLLVNSTGLLPAIVYSNGKGLFSLWTVIRILILTIVAILDSFFDTPPVSVAELDNDSIFPFDSQLPADSDSDHDAKLTLDSNCDSNLGSDSNEDYDSHFGTTRISFDTTRISSETDSEGLPQVDFSDHLDGLYMQMLHCGRNNRRSSDISDSFDTYSPRTRSGRPSFAGPFPAPVEIKPETAKEQIRRYVAELQENIKMAAAPKEEEEDNSWWDSMKEGLEAEIDNVSSSELKAPSDIQFDH